MSTEQPLITSLKSLKNTVGFGPTNDTRSANAPYIDKGLEREQDRQDRWVYTTSMGLGPHGTPATSDPTDPRRHRRGAMLASLPAQSEPSPLPEGPLENYLP